MANPTFVMADYVVFALMLLLSVAIGIYYAHRGRKRNQKALGYLLANRSMTMIPVAISLSMSFNSSLTMMAVPAEVYQFGTMISWVLVLFVIIAVITSEVFLPTFYRLGISSTYEYLELRFGKVARVCGTVVFIVASIFYCGIVIYGPALAFEAVSGFPLWAAIVSNGLVCTVYTSVGGLEGVIWTDVFQGFVMISGMLAFLIKGNAAVGGVSNAWRIAERGGRIDFVHFESDPRIRNTFWSIVISGIVRWSGMYGVSQSQVQRYLSCKSERQAKLSIYLNVIGLVLLFTMSVMTGVVIYAYYETCDPLQNKCVRRSDQIFPFMMLDLFRDVPGASGLILSAAYAGSLSSVSSGVNAMTTVTMEDIIKPLTKDKITDDGYLRISKVVAIIFGLLCIGMSFLLSTTSELLQAAFSLMGMLMGSLTGFFLLALQFPFANSIGAVSGLITGITSSVWFYLGTKSIHKSNEFIRKLPLRVDGCQNSCAYSSSMHTMNNTLVTTVLNSSVTPLMQSLDLTEYSTTSEPDTEHGDGTGIFMLSYHYISVIGLVICISVGVLTSLATGGWATRQHVDKRLLRPPFDHYLFKSWLPERLRWYLRFCIEWTDNVSDANRSSSHPGVERDEILQNNANYDDIALDDKNDQTSPCVNAVEKLEV